MRKIRGLFTICLVMLFCSCSHLGLEYAVKTGNIEAVRSYTSRPEEKKKRDTLEKSLDLAIELKKPDIAALLVKEPLNSRGAVIGKQDLFTLALETGSTVLVEALYAAKVDLDSIDEKNRMLIHKAVSAKDYNLVETLLACNADVDAQIKDDNDRQTPLHLAVVMQDEKMIRLLLDAGADLTKVAYNIVKVHFPQGYNSWSYGTPPQTAALLESSGVLSLFIETRLLSQDHLDSLIYFAVENNRGKHLPMLLEAGARINPPGGKDIPLCIALFRQDLLLVKQLISYGADVNLRTYNGYYPVHSAKDYPEGIKYLLESRLDVTVTDDYERTLLHHFNGELLEDPVIARALLAKIDINAGDNQGDTPLITAVHDEDYKKVLFLLNNGAKVNQLSKYGGSALFFAADCDVSFVKLLVERGARLDVQRSKKMGSGSSALYTPLHEAVHYGYVENALFLIDAGSPLNLQDLEGNTPLHKACGLNWHGKPFKEVIKKLAGKKGTLNIKNKKGKTPLAVLLEHEDEDSEIVKLLFSHGARR